MRQLIWNLNLFICGVILVILTGVGVHEMVRGISWLERHHLRTNASSDENAKTLKEVTAENHLDYFLLHQSSLSSKDAAHEWVTLATTSLGIIEKADDSAPEFKNVLRVIPGPKSWPHIGLELENLSVKRSASPEKLLALESLAALLDHNPKDALQKLDNILSPDLPPKGPQKREALLVEVFSTQMAIAEQTMEPAEVLDLFKKQLSQLETTHFVTEMDSSTAYRVPDLVTLAGEAEAEKLLRRAFKAIPAPLDIPSFETHQLAVTICESMVNHLQTPQVLLLQTSDSFDLYKKMVEIYGPDRFRKSDLFRSARKWYILDLIAQNMDATACDEINAFNVDFDDVFHLTASDLAALSDQQVSFRIFDFLGKTFVNPNHKNLLLDPTQNLWREYAFFGERLSRQEDMLILIHRLHQKNRFTVSDKRQLRFEEARIQLNAGKIDEATNTLRALMGENPKEDDALSLRAAARLAQLGQAKALPKLEEEGLAFFCDHYESLNLSDPSSDVEHDLSSLFHLFSEEKYHARWERLLWRDLRLSEKDLSISEISTHQNLRPQLRRLLELFCREGKWHSAAKLLNESKWWGTGDLSAIIDDAESQGPPLGILAAQVFHGTGEDLKAVRILEEMMRLRMELDDIGRLYLEWVGADQALKKFDQLIATHPYDDWPRIWKARTLIQLQKFPEANAILTDPKHPWGYDEPSDDNPLIASAKLQLQLRPLMGAKDEEGDRVLSKRISAVDGWNKADLLDDLDLRSDAIDELEKAHALFPDSVFLGLHLADLYARHGMTKQSEDLYVQVLKTLPDHITNREDRLLHQLDTVEPDSVLTTTVDTFQQKLKGEPHKSALELSTGLLLFLKNEEQISDSWDLIKSSAQDDPDSYPAWFEWQDFTSNKYSPPRERRAILDALERLTPPADEFDGNYEMIPDMDRIWTLGNRKMIPPVTLLPLKNSRKLLRLGRLVNPTFHEGMKTESGGDALSGAWAVKKIMELIEQLDN